MKTTVKLILVLSLFCFIAGKAWADLNDGLVAYYPFNGNANDESGNGNHGIVNGATLTEDRLGNANSAYRFDGVDDYLEILSNSLLNFGTGDLSIGLWVSTEGIDAPKEVAIIDKRSSPTLGYVLYHKNGNIGFQLAMGGKHTNYTNYMGVQSNCPSLALHKWKFVLITIDRDQSNGGKLYVDASLVSTFDPTNRRDTIDNAGNLLMAKNAVDADFPNFKGKLDDIRIYNRSLFEHEVQNVYIVSLGGFTQHHLDSVELKGKQECITNPASCDLFSQAQLDSAKQTGINEGKETGLQECLNNPSSCGIDVEKNTDGSTQAGIEKCQNNPESCGIVDINGSTQTGIDQCKANPTSCGIVTNPSRDAVIAECQNNPAACGITTELLGCYTQDAYDKAYDNGWQACKDDPTCAGNSDKETTITLTGDGFYKPGEFVNIQLTENLDVHRFYRVDLWVIIELPDGGVLYMTDIPLNPFDIKPQPFLRSLESSNRTHQILDFEVPIGMGGDYVIYAFFNKADADLSLLVKTLSSNIAVSRVTLRSY